jgi:hypothetical protein
MQESSTSVRRHLVKLPDQTWGYVKRCAASWNLSLDDAIERVVNQHASIESERVQVAATMDRMRAAVEKRDKVLKANGIVVE